MVWKPPSDGRQERKAVGDSGGGRKLGQGEAWTSEAEKRARLAASRCKGTGEARRLARERDEDGGRDGVGRSR